MIDGLRRRIGALERHVPLPVREGEGELWTLGEAGIDAGLGPSGLDKAGLHQVKPAAAGAGDRAAALAFALRLAVRRLLRMSTLGARRPARVLWCWPAAIAHEAGRLYGPGLAGLGFDPRALLIVETAGAAEALWALEEGLKSGSLALAVGVIDEVALTPARRLALAAEKLSTPALLVTGAAMPPAGATATRWRVGAAASAGHPFNAEAPGAPRAAITLERCRGRPATEELSRVLEWSDETLRFRVAAAMEHRASAPSLGARRLLRSRAG